MTFKAPSPLLNKKTFVAGYAVLLDYFGKAQAEATIAFVFTALKDQDPYLTCGQWEFIVKRSMVSFTFMPKLNDMLGLIYRRDLSGMPQLPDIDPRMCDQYQQGIYERAKQAQDKWLMSTPIKPLVGNYGLASLGASDPSLHVEYAGDNVPDIDAFAWLGVGDDLWRAQLMPEKLRRKDWQYMEENGFEFYLEDACLPPLEVTEQFIKLLPSLAQYDTPQLFQAYYEQFPQLNPTNKPLLLASA